MQRSIGLGEVYQRVLRELVDEDFMPISRIFETLWQSSEVFTDWKKGNITPIFKSWKKRPEEVQARGTRTDLSGVPVQTS